MTEHKPETAIQTVEPMGHVGHALEQIRKTDDPDLQAEILNTAIVRFSDEGVASSQSVALVRDLAQEQQVTALQHRPDAIVGLNSDSLVSIANGLVSEEDPDNQSTRGQDVFSVAQRIKESDGETEGGNINTEFEEQIFHEIEERLLGQSGDPREQEEVVASLDDLMTQGLFNRIVRNPSLLATIALHVHELNNDELRTAITQVMRDLTAKETPREEEPGDQEEE